MLGETLSHYRIIEKIGSGGMDDVYRDRDTKQERHVAIKGLRAGLASEPELLRRFEREARSASALNYRGREKSRYSLRWVSIEPSTQANPARILEPV